MVEQQRATGKSLHLAKERHPRFATQPMQVALALGQRQASQVDTILMQQIEDKKHQLAFVRRIRPHLGHQAIKMRCPAGIDQAQFAIEDRRLRRQLAECLDHVRQTVGVFSAMA